MEATALAGSAETAKTAGASSDGVRSQLVTWATQALPVIASGIGFVGFVSVLGAALLWVRFDAAQLPADEAVSKFPRSDLVATGAVSLVLYLVLGLLAVLLVYLLQERYDPDRDDLGDLRSDLAVARAEASTVESDLTGAKAEVDAESPPSEWTTERHARLLSMKHKALDAVDRLEDRLLQAESREREPAAHPHLSNQIGLIVLVAVEAAIVVLNADAGSSTRAFLAILVIATAISVIYLGTATKFGHEDEHRVLLGLPEVSVSDGFWRWLLQSFQSSLQLMAVIVPFALSALLIDGWVLIPIGVALVLAVGCLGVGRLHPTRFFWYGCSIFASVVLFGAALTFTQDRRDPAMQPAAVIFKNGAGIHALWITETSDRIYLARVRTTPDSEQPVKNGGSIFWLNRSDVMGYDVGDLQPIREANAAGPGLLGSLRADQIKLNDPSQADPPQADSGSAGAPPPGS